MTDMADTVRENGASVIKIALAEKDKKEREMAFKKAEGTKTQKFFFLFFSLILIIGAVLGTYFLYQKKIEKETPQLISKSIETLLPYEDQASINISEIEASELLPDLILSEVKKTELNFMKAIFIKDFEITKDKKGNEIKKEKRLNSRQFLAYISKNIPNSLIETFSDEFMIGSFSKENKIGTFLIFQTNNYNLSFAKMLEWEKSLTSDLDPIFKTNLTSTDVDIFSRGFKDLMIKNKDVRVLYDIDNNKILLYSFIDKNKLVITNNEDTLKEIMERNNMKNSRAN